MLLIKVTKKESLLQHFIQAIVKSFYLPSYQNPICMNPCFAYLSRGLSCFRAFSGLHLLGVLLPPGQVDYQILADGLQRLVLCPCWSGAKTESSSIEEWSGLHDNDVCLPFEFGIGRPLPTCALFQVLEFYSHFIDFLYTGKR